MDKGSSRVFAPSDSFVISRAIEVNESDAVPFVRLSGLFSLTMGGPAREDGEARSGRGEAPAGDPGAEVSGEAAVEVSGAAIGLDPRPAFPWTRVLARAGAPGAEERRLRETAHIPARSRKTSVH